MSKEQTIFIENPVENNDQFRSYFLDYDYVDEFILQLDDQQITPSSHPAVLELFAGDGPIASVLSKKGWTKLTCIDKEKPPDDTNLTPKDTKWLFMDLLELNARIVNNLDTTELEQFEHQFDIVTATFAIDVAYTIPRPIRERLCKFFCRNNGFIFIW